MNKDENEGRSDIEPTPDARGKLQSVIDHLNRELRAFVTVALRHGLRDYCETRHPEMTVELDQSDAQSQRHARKKYDRVLAKIIDVPGLCGCTGDTAERTYYRNAQDNVAYIEHALKK